MKHVLPLSLAALVLAACHPAPKAPDTPVPPVPAAAPVPPSPPATPAFVVSDMGDGDGHIQGCTTSLYRDDAGMHQIFTEDGVDTDGTGFMRIDGKLIKLALTSSTHSDKGGVRAFASADKQLTVTENYLIGAAHEESDSVELKGTLDVSYKGVLQSFVFSGGTAC